MSSAPRPAESSEPAVSTERKGSAVIAKVRVKLLDDNSLRLLSQLIDQSAGTEGVSTVIVDLSKVELLPSLGLGMLLDVHQVQIAAAVVEAGLRATESAAGIHHYEAGPGVRSERHRRGRHAVAAHPRARLRLA